jgi:hypothetical protein
MSDIMMYVNAHYNGSTIINDWKAFTEMGREWLQVKSTAGTPSGNGYYGGNVTVFEQIYVSGNYFNPRSDVTLYWDYGATSQQVLATVSVNSTGFFNTTVTIPEANVGNHSITAVDFSFNFNATLTVDPTLILTPDEGPIGTVVTATGYGFPNNATNVNVTIWWDYTCYCYECEPEVLNLTVTKTDPNGKFVIIFTVPSTVGGIHDVWAEGDLMGTYASDTFNVLPTIVVSPTTATNNGTKVVVTITGLASVSTMEEEGYYDLCIDYEKDFEWLLANCSGILEFEFFVTAGMEPGVHVVSIYLYEGWPSYTVRLIDHAFFTVTTEEEDPEMIMKLDEILEGLDDIDATLTDIADDVANIDFTAIQDAIADAQTAVLGAISNVEAVAQNAATAATEASTSAGTAAQSASDAKTASEATQGTVSGISTAVYGAIVLSLIAALASIIAVITLQRKVA